MAWRDQLRPASFRGVLFFVETEEVSGGRKTVTHEYPLKDEAFVEDMGRKTRGFSLDGFVIGANYMSARDALIAALETEGPGALVLHYGGERKVACGAYRYRETADDGGMARFSMEFIETPAQPIQPAAATVSTIAVATKANALSTVLSSTFTDVFSVLRQPQFAIDSVTQLLTDAASELDAAFAPIITAAQDLATFKRSVTNMIEAAEDLVRAPTELAAEVAAILGLAPLSAGVSRETVTALIKAYDFTTTAPVPDEDTPTRTTEAANQAALTAFWRSAIIAQAAIVIVDVGFDSYDDAVEARDQILTRLDAESETAGDDVFPALQSLRAALVVAVPGPDNDLVRLVPVTPPTTVPSVVLAYSLYGDLDSELDLVARNRIRHAGFIPGGVQLQVLGRA